MDQSLLKQLMMKITTGMPLLLIYHFIQLVRVNYTLRRLYYVQCTILDE